MLALLAPAACHTQSGDPARAHDGAAPLAAPSASVADDAVHSVYPLDVPPHPLALRLCEALHELPEQRRTACCKSAPAATVTSECLRMLSYAIETRALVLPADGVDRCSQAMERTYAGCDWPGPFQPDLPDECRGLMQGALPKGAVCRSSLECAGDLRCRGVGPTATGKCDAAGAPGEPCGAAVDALAGYTLQLPLDHSHPDCVGFCDRRRCTAERPPSDGGAPQGSPNGLPVPPLVARKAKGAACTNDVECVGGCIKPDGGKKGVCGPKCSAR